MDNRKLAAAVVVLGAAYYYWRTTQYAADIFNSSGSNVGNDNYSNEGYTGSQDSGGFIQTAFSNIGDWWDSVSGTADVYIMNPILMNKNVQAFLKLIQYGELSPQARSNPDLGYRQLVGGGYFTSFASHPHDTMPQWKGLYNPRVGKYSYAAGMYQINYSNWVAYKSRLSLPDFGPASQDLIAVTLIKDIGALDDVKAGRFKAAMYKLRTTWESFPDAGNPQYTVAQAKQILLSNGATVTDIA